MRLIVIGGGAAGFFCAVNAAEMNRSLEVVIVERSSRVLSKLRISGGGRCNVTHACFSIPEILDRYPRGGNFLKKSFHEFFTTDTVAWFARRGVALKTEDDGRMFPVTDNSETIAGCLLGEASRLGVQVMMNRDVKRVCFEDGMWEVICGSGDNGGGDKMQADYVCVACGGYPKSGMFEWIRDLGHTVVEPVPSLFTFNIPGNDITRLMGVSTEAGIRLRIPGAVSGSGAGGGRATRYEGQGPVLITHWGISGPAVLKLSARAARELHAAGYDFSVLLNWCPGYNENSMDEKLAGFRNGWGSKKVWGRNELALPLRLWEFLCESSQIPVDMRWADLSAVLRRRLAKNCCAMELAVKGKTVFREEFVTAGGIRLAEIDPLTMESRLRPGLYFAGEVMDVDGVTGGFNFQHAWTSGWLAGKNISLHPRNKTIGSIYV